MPTALYRLSSGEVEKISLTNQSFADRDTTYWGVLTDPTIVDGNVTRPLRVLGFAKIWDGSVLRNATQPEIETFAPAEADDQSQEDADQAISFLETHPVFRKQMIAFADILKDEINLLRAREQQFQADVAAANNLAALKASVAAYPAMSARTLAQLRTQIRNRVSKDD